MFLAYIAGMDTFAHGLRIAAKLLEDNVLEDFIAKRYESYNFGIGYKIKNKEVDLETCAQYALNNQNENLPSSGRQEMLESILNQYIYNN